jgi:hypothetical protein
MTETESPPEFHAELVGAIDDRRSFLFPTSPGRVGRSIRGAIGENQGARDLLVLVVAPEPSDAMRDRGEIVTPVVMARGRPDALLRGGSEPGGLTSATTRRAGLVANLDVAPTVLSFTGQPVPSGSPGSPIRPSGEPPTDLLRRYLEYREVAVPVGLIALGIALALLGAGLVVLLGPWSVPAGAVAALAAVGLFAVALQVAMLPGSWLPTYSWPVVAAVVGGTALVLTLVAVAVGRESPVAPAAVVAGGGLTLAVVDAALGWPSLLTPFLGGSALEGGRFYGLGNSYAGMVLAGAVLAAAVLRPWAGVALITAAALFAGLPWLGADLGGGITLFAVAALWWGLRVRPRFGALEVAVVVAAAVAGALLLVLLHRLAPAPSHVSRAIQEAGGLGGILVTFWDRLTLNVRATLRTPAVWPALIGVPVALAVAWARPGPFRRPLDQAPAWRLGLIALAVGGILGYVLNDTYGMAGVAFIYLALGLVYPALRLRSQEG